MKAVATVKTCSVSKLRSFVFYSYNNFNLILKVSFKGLKHTQHIPISIIIKFLLIKSYDTLELFYRLFENIN